MKRLLVAVLAIVLVSIACRRQAPSADDKFAFWTTTPNATQTPLVMEITTTPDATQTPELVVVTATPGVSSKCVNALFAVHLRPSPSNENYPVTVLPNGAEVRDLGGRSGNWLFVQYEDKQGWVDGGYIGECNE